MNYKAIYEKFIADRKANPTKDLLNEGHYIIPLQIGGSRNAENMVRLGVRDSIFARILLHKIYPILGTSNRKEGSRRLAAEHIEWLIKNNSTEMTNRLKNQSYANDRKMFKNWYNKNLNNLVKLVHETILNYIIENGPCEAAIQTNFGKRGSKFLKDFVSKYRDYITLKNPGVSDVVQAKLEDIGAATDNPGLTGVDTGVKPAEELASACKEIEGHRLPEIVETIKEYDPELGKVVQTSTPAQEYGIFNGADTLLREFCNNTRDSKAKTDLNVMLAKIIDVEYGKETEENPVYSTLPPQAIELIKRDTAVVVISRIASGYVNKADSPSLKSGGDRYARNFILSQVKAEFKRRVMSYCYLHPVTDDGFRRDDMVFKGVINGYGFSTKESVAYAKAIKAGEPGLAEKRPSSFNRMLKGLQELVGYASVYGSSACNMVKAKVSMEIVSKFDRFAAEWISKNKFSYFDGTVAARLIQEITIETLKEYKDLERR